MAGQCPKCASKIMHDFGIVSCHECGAILSIDFDGNVSLSDPEDQPSEQSASSDPPPFPPATEVGSTEQFSEFQTVQPAENYAQEAHVEQDHNITMDFASSHGEQEVESEPEPTPEFQDNWINNDEPSSGPPPAQEKVDFTDVVEYANSVELDNSPLVYAFRIEGIDHKDIRKKVLDVLSDIRLNIHVKDLIPTIKGGILELHDLSPVRASIIASRLREELVTFRWRQSVFQSETPAAESGS